MKPPEKRSSTDIKLLVECTKHVKFFMDLVTENGKEIHEKCCKYMTYEKYTKGEIIFEQGTLGETFYITLKGCVSILVNIPKINEINNDKGEKINKVEFVLTDVKTLYSGASFGELALIDNKPRAATIKCKENSHFAVLQKKYFNNILSQLIIYIYIYIKKFIEEVEKQKLYTEIEFLRSLDVLNSWTYNAVKYLFYHTSRKTYTMKSVVYKEGDEATHFYIIRSGEFQVDLPVTLPLEGSLLFKRKFEKSNNKYNLGSKNSIIKFLKFVILSSNEYFGFEELIYNTKRNHRVKCISEFAEVSIINKKEFIRRFWGDPKTQENFIKIMARNHELRQSRLHDYVNIEQSVGILRKPSLLEDYFMDSEGSSQQKPESSLHEERLNPSHSLYFSNNLNNQSLQKSMNESKLKQSITIHENNESLVKLLEQNTPQNVASQQIHMIYVPREQRTSSSKIGILSEPNEINNALNLVDFARKHDETMNLHRKLKSLEIRAKTLNDSNHITSKIDFMKELRCSFKPPEIVKLQAFKLLDEKQKEFENYSQFRGKKKIEEDQKFFIPKIVQRKIIEKVEINKTLAKLNSKLEKISKRKNLNKSGSSTLFYEEKMKELEKRREDKNENNMFVSKTNDEKNKHHYKVNSLMFMNKEFLPLKYNIDKYRKK